MNAKLQKAIRAKDTIKIRSLVSQGADVNCKDYSGRPMIYLATLNNSPTVVKTLLELGCDVNATHWIGKTSLMCAAGEGNDSIVKLLLGHGANVNLQNEDGTSSLHFAALDGHDRVVKLLIESKATIHLQNNYGDTPLHWAARWNHGAVVKVLLANKANPDIKNKRGLTALQVAEEEGNRNAVDAIKEFNADSQSLIPRDRITAMERNNFYQALSEGKMCVHRAHINVVGQDRVGKTCFVLALLNQAFKNQASTDAVAVKLICKESTNWKEYTTSADSILATAWQHKSSDLSEKMSSQAEQQQDHEATLGKALRLGAEEVVLQSNDGEEETRLSADLSGDSISSTSGQEQQDLQSKEISAVGTQKNRSREFEELLEKLKLNDDDLAAIKMVLQRDPDILQKNSDKVFLAIIWDHAGQEPFLPSHSALLGNVSLHLSSDDDPLSECVRACGLYLIVFDQSKLLTDKAVPEYQPDPNQDPLSYRHCWMKQNMDYLRYWLTQLQCAFPNVQKDRRYIGHGRGVLYPPVAVVGTHDADPKAEKNRKKQNDTLARVFKDKKYQDHLVKPGGGNQFFRVENALSGAEGEDPAKDVRQLIEVMTEDCWSKCEQPLKWFHLEKILKRLVQITGRNIIDLPFFKELALKLCQIADEHINVLLKYLNNLRVILHFPEVQSSRHTFLCEELRDKVFVAPAWLVKAISLFVTIVLTEPPPNLKCAWDNLKSTGVLDWSLTEYFLGEQKLNVPKQYQKAVIGFLCLFDLMCPVDKVDQLAVGMKFYAPSLVTTLYEDEESKPPYEWENWKADSGLPPPLLLVPSKLDTFPEPLYQRLIVRMLWKYHPDIYELHRNRSLLAIESKNLELAYHNREYVIATVAGEPGKMTEHNRYDEFSRLRETLVEELNCAKEPGMNGFEFELFAIAKKEMLSAEDICQARSSKLIRLRGLPESQYLRFNNLAIVEGDYRDIFLRWFGGSTATGISDSMRASSETKGSDIYVPDTLPDTEVTDEHLTIIAGGIGSHWYRIGIELGFKYQEMQNKGYDKQFNNDNFRCLLAVLNDWKGKEDKPRVGALVNACKKAGIGAEAMRLLKYKDSSKQ